MATPQLDAEVDPSWMQEFFDHSSPDGIKAWAKKMGIYTHPAVVLGVRIPGMGVGVVTSAPLQKGTVVVSSRAVLSPDVNKFTVHTHGKPSDVCLHRLQAALKGRPYLYVVVLLMIEVGRGRESPLAPYLQSMPLFRHHISMLDEQLADAALHGSELYTCHVEDYPLRRMWEEHVVPLMREHEDLFPNCRSKTYSYPVFAQCALQVLSRNFHIGDDDEYGPFIVPVVDFANHSSRYTNVSFQRKSASTFELVATRDIKKGEQLWVNYGAYLDLARYCFEFGFLEEKPKQPPPVEFRLSTSWFARYFSDFLLKGISSPSDDQRRRGIDAACAAFVKNLTPESGSGDVNMEVLKSSIAERMRSLQHVGLLYKEGVILSTSTTPGGSGSGHTTGGLTNGRQLHALFALLGMTAEHLNDAVPHLTRWATYNGFQDEVDETEEAERCFESDVPLAQARELVTDCVFSYRVEALKASLETVEGVVAGVKGKSPVDAEELHMWATICAVLSREYEAARNMHMTFASSDGNVNI